MTEVSELRRAIIGLLGFAATQEQMLLAATPADETGSARCWAAAPLVAHNSEFKHQQVERLRSVREGVVPRDFAEADHSSADLYEGLVAQSGLHTARESAAVTAELIDGTRLVSADDLLDPSRHPWLRGRQLWLQVIVRGFWHPTGHLIDYYLAHDRPAEAVAVASHGVVTADQVGAPDPARGMAAYNMACAQSRSGDLDAAARALRDAIGLNKDIRANAGRDPDLAAVRSSGLVERELWSARSDGM
jgi:hypothetical protein